MSDLSAHRFFVPDVRMPTVHLNQTVLEALSAVAAHAVGGLIVQGDTGTARCYLSARVLDEEVKARADASLFSILGTLLPRSVPIASRVDKSARLEPIESGNVYIVAEAHQIGWLLDSRALYEDFDVPQPRCPPPCGRRKPCPIHRIR